MEVFGKNKIMMFFFYIKYRHTQSLKTYSMYDFCGKNWVAFDKSMLLWKLFN